MISRRTYLLKLLILILGASFYRMASATEIKTSNLCEDAVRNSLILPEFASLPENRNAILPMTVIKKYDSREIGVQIAQRVTRLRQKELAQTAPTGPVIDFFKDSELQLLVDSASVPGILISGVLNQHEMFLSSGDYGPSARLDYETDLAQLIFPFEYQVDDEDLETHSESQMPAALAKVLPKYAMVSIDPKSGARIIESIHEKVERYGDIVIILKPAVKQRTTMTLTDSFDKPYVQPYRLSEIGILPNLEHTRYLEAQIWGEIDLRDIQEFRVPPKVSPITQKLLEAAGLPIYEYQLKKNNQYERARGRLLSDPNAVSPVFANVVGKVSKEVIDSLNNRPLLDEIENLSQFQDYENIKTLDRHIYYTSGSSDKKVSTPGIQSKNLFDKKNRNRIFTIYYKTALYSWKSWFRWNKILKIASKLKNAPDSSIKESDRARVEIKQNYIILPYEIKTDE